MSTPAPSLAAHVKHAADALREANHATFRGPLTPNDAYDVVGHLDDLVQRLPQLLEYLARSMLRADPADYFDDRGADPADALWHANGELTDAGNHLAEIGRHLASTHNALGHLGRHTPED